MTEGIKEIRVTYEDNSEVIYRGKGIRKFIREISEPSLDTLTTSKSEKAPQTSGGYHVSGVTYTPIGKDITPQQLAREMQKEAEARGMKFN